MVDWHESEMVVEDNVSCWTNHSKKRGTRMRMKWIFTIKRATEFQVSIWISTLPLNYPFSNIIMFFAPDSYISSLITLESILYKITHLVIWLKNFPRAWKTWKPLIPDSSIDIGHNYVQGLNNHLYRVIHYSKLGFVIIDWLFRILCSALQISFILGLVHVVEKLEFYDSFRIHSSALEISIPNINLE